MFAGIAEKWRRGPPLRLPDHVRLPLMPRRELVRHLRTLSAADAEVAHSTAAGHGARR